MGYMNGHHRSNTVSTVAFLDQVPLFAAFLDLKKPLTQWLGSLLVLVWYGVGPNMIRPIRNFWDCSLLGKWQWQLRRAFLGWLWGDAGQTIVAKAL